MTNSSFQAFGRLVYPDYIKSDQTRNGDVIKADP